MAEKNCVTCSGKGSTGVLLWKKPCTNCNGTGKIVLSREEIQKRVRVIQSTTGELPPDESLDFTKEH